MPGRKGESRIMLLMLLASILNCVVDIVVAYADGRPGGFNHALLVAGNCYLYIYNMIVGICLINMIVKHIDRKTSVMHMVFFWVLCIVEASLLIINFFIPVVYEVDQSNLYHRGIFYYLFVIIGFTLILYGYIYYFISKIKNPSLRYFPVIEFLMPILLGTIVQMCVYGLSLLPVTFTVAFAGIVIAFQNECIYIDKLTGVYNRFELDKELKRLQSGRKEKIVAYMLDLNGFKSINDNYSHEEGDQALIAFANILVDVFGSVGTVIRFAGDEFVVLVRKANESNIEIYKQKTTDAVDRYNESSGKPYKLSAAVGGKVFDFKNEDTQDLVVVIDTLMYKDKNDFYKDNERKR
ncbi:MAG: GGDEF domain-containing protein [Clostridiales bacterium]|nr:GGDEF domain-containing protein [Clostridiales bacterium]